MIPTDGHAYTLDRGQFHIDGQRADGGGGNPPTSVQFYADTYVWNNGVGGYATVYWSVAGATNAMVGGQSVAVPSGSMTLHITSSQRVTLDTWNSYGHTTAYIDFQVNAVPPPSTGKPIINSFTCTPNPVPQGSTGLLYWEVDPNGLTTSVTISTIGAVANSGSQGITVNADIQLVLTATNSAGTSTMTLSIGETTALQVAIDSFTANGLPSAITVAPGASVDVAWATSNAVQVTLEIGNQGPVVKPASGSVGIGPFNETTTLTLIATGTGAGNVHAQQIDIIVSTTGTAPVIGSFTATPSSVEVGGSSVLSWVISGATSATLKAGNYTPISVDPAAGSQQALDLTQTVIYTLTATNGYGTVSKTVTVIVGTVVPPASSSLPLIIGGAALLGVLLVGRNKK